MMPGSEDDYSGQHLYLTLDEQDENRVLELVRVDGPDYYIRRDGEWLTIDPDEDNERVWDRVIVDVTPEAVTAYDQAEDADPVVRLDTFTAYEIPDEDAA